MQYRRLGSAGTRVSVIGLGGWINFEKKIPLKEARRIVKTAIEGGVNFFDVADVYGKGEAESWMGALLRPYLRHTLVVSTKVFGQMSDSPNDRGLSRKHIMESIDGSLARLGMGYVDIYFCHRPDPETPLLETARAMSDLIHQGKVVYWGTSQWEPEQIVETFRLCKQYGLFPPQVEQPQYSMLHRERVEQSIIPIAVKHGLGLTVYSPLAFGMLTGKYDEGVPEDSRFTREAWAKDRFLTDDNTRRVASLKSIADDLGITRGQLALAWALRDPAISSLISGATHSSQIAENIGAASVSLSAESLTAIDAALA